jgi:ABC-type amino acid transport substrate-binding protein
MKSVVRARRRSAFFLAFAVLCVPLAACGASGSSSTSATGKAPHAGLPKPLPYDASLFKELPASIRSSKVIVMAEVSQPPYYSVGASGAFGIGPDVSQYLSDLLGVKVKTLNTTSVASGALTLSGGRAQAFFGPTLDTLQIEHGGANYIDWTSVTQGLLYKKGDKVTSELSFCGHLVATEATIPTEDYLASLAKACKAHGLAAETTAFYPGIPQLVTAVQDGRAYASNFSSISTLYDVRQQPSLFGAYVVPSSDIAPLLGFGLAVGTKTGTLTKVLFQALATLKKAGILTADFTYWGLPPSSHTLDSTFHVNDYNLNAGLGHAVCCTVSG